MCRNAIVTTRGHPDSGDPARMRRREGAAHSAGREAGRAHPRNHGTEVGWSPLRAVPRNGTVTRLMKTPFIGMLLSPFLLMAQQNSGAWTNIGPSPAAVSAIAG